MFLKRKRSGRYEYLDLVASVSIDGVSKTKRMQHFSRIDKILKEEPYVIYLTYKSPDVCIDIYRRVIEGCLQGMELHVHESPQDIGEQRVGCGKSLLLNYGHLLVKQYRNRYLNLSYKINRIQIKKTDIRLLSLSRLTGYLAATKIMQPFSA